MTTAASVPSTYGELEGDEAFETLRATGRRRLTADAITRFRAADGFSHSRALAFQVCLTLLPAIIAIVGLAAALDQETFARVVRETIAELAPGAVGDILTEALQQGTRSARQETGETALVGGFIAALLAGTTALAQIERGANRIYGVERDRPFVRKYLLALVLALTVGTLALLSVIVLVAGSTVRDAAGWSDGFDTVWAALRWPLGVACVVGAISLLLEVSPYRRQPEASWLAFGGAVSAVLWLAFMGVLKVYVDATESFGSTYGPLAGTIGLLLWAFLSSVALFGGLAMSAQLEAVRAGAPQPRRDP